MLDHHYRITMSIFRKISLLQQLCIYPCFLLFVLCLQLTTTITMKLMLEILHPG